MSALPLATYISTCCSDAVTHKEFIIQKHTTLNTPSPHVPCFIHPFSLGSVKNIACCSSAVSSPIIFLTNCPNIINYFCLFWKPLPAIISYSANVSAAWVNYQCFFHLYRQCNNFLLGDRRSVCLSLFTVSLVLHPSTSKLWQQQCQSLPLLCDHALQLDLVHQQKCNNFEREHYFFSRSN